MYWLHFGTARGWKSRFIAVALVLLGMPHGVGYDTYYRLDSPQDDRKLREKLYGRAELQPLVTESNNLVSGRLWPLTDDQIGKIFGPTLAQRPPNLVLPIFDTGGRWVPGPSANSFPGRLRVDLRAVGDVGYVEFYFTWVGVVSSAAFYSRADGGFVPLRTEADFAKRLQWDATKFVRISQWLNQHLPPSTDLGDVDVADRVLSPVHLSNGKDVQVSALLDSMTAYYVMVSVDPQQAYFEGDREGFGRKIDRPDEVVGFAIDGQFYRLTPKLKNQPTLTDLGVIPISRNTPTPLNVGADKECIASVHSNRGGFTAIYLRIKCASYREQIIKAIPMPGRPITFAIDGNVVSFIPELNNF